ncbi:uncharacterized protein KY384_008527 [Bacidia gigantensis]|uniref:uncharacterized protein n=1 Tax=Bacidia gigantensis TaxID=2732470 RepID=UPI001D03ECD8|nr:uncharacterized protein KY384_008527 [Bacidia gigantensis]KAG8527098.1 hypothetical protein KY384_008527 [Bacidia gigantensis]
MNCQNCRSPLKLHSSLEDLDPASYDLLVGSTGQTVDTSLTPTRLPYGEDRKQRYDEATKNASAPIFKRTIPAAQQSFPAERSMTASTRNDPSMSFALLTESEVMPARRASSKQLGDGQHDPASKGTKEEADLDDANNVVVDPIEASTRLFEILSSRSDIDHPICTECTEILLTQLKTRLDSSTRERDAYISFLKGLNNSAPTPEEVAKAEESLAESKAAEVKAFAELQALEKEKADLDEEIANLEAESLSLDEEEETFWRERNAFALELSSFQNERDALTAAHEHDAEQLEQLRRTNVYNDALHITQDGTFATINGLRLGRLQKYAVDWAEINAAWGYAALLLATVAEKLGFTFRGYTIKPLGSTSYIEREEIASPQNSLFREGQSTTAHDRSTTTTTKLELCSSGDVPIGAALYHRNINAAMVAFLECVRQLNEHVENLDMEAPSTRLMEAMKIPYNIKNDKIGSDTKAYVSIKLHGTNDKEWTEACKFTLTNFYRLMTVGKESMHCEICHRPATSGLPFNCELCAQLAVYKPRVALAESLLKNEGLEKDVEKQTTDPQHGEKTSSELSPEWKIEQVEAETDRSYTTREDIMAEVKALRGEIQHMKLNIAKRKALLVRRRKDQASARQELKGGQIKGKPALEEDIAQISQDWELLNQRIMKERSVRCFKMAELFALQRHKQQKSSRSRDIYMIGYIPIPDLRELNGIKPEEVTTCLSHIAHLVYMTAFYLSLKLPAEILLPTSKYPDPTILSPNVSYTTKDPILPTPPHSKKSSPVASRHLDHSNQPRARPLFLIKRLCDLAKDNPRDYAYVIEGITLLAWDIAWLCRTQGLDIGTKSWDEVCAIGKNLYDLLVSPLSPRKTLPNSAQNPPQPPTTKTPTKPEDITSPPPPPPHFSHGSAYAFLSASRGTEYMREWRLANPVKVIDRVKTMLLAERTGSEWEILEGKEWAEEDMKGPMNGAYGAYVEGKVDVARLESPGDVRTPGVKAGPSHVNRVERGIKGYYVARQR